MHASPKIPDVPSNTKVPLLGAGLIADATEMGRFMHRMLRRDFLPPALHDLQEDVSMPYEQVRCHASCMHAIVPPSGSGPHVT